MAPRDARRDDDGAATAAARAPLRPPAPPAGASASATDDDWADEELVLLEANVDDMTGEVAGDVIDALMNRPAADGARALDAWATPITMKKGRPALTMHVLCRGGAGDAPGAGDARALTRALFEHTSTLGVRSARLSRAALPRRFARGVATRFGAVDVKLGVLGGRVVTVHPEYEDCRARAAAARVPVRRVMHAALATALSALPPEESGLAEVPRRPA